VRVVQNSTNNVIQQFDIIAVRPMTERFFLAACATLEVDIISLDLQEYAFPSTSRRARLFVIYKLIDATTMTQATAFQAQVSNHRPGAAARHPL
jgi:hypothetical protein